MAFIGNTPTAVPLTGSQIADGTIVNANIATNTINLTQKVTATLPYAQGGTGLSTLGTAGQALIVNSSATALSYATVGATAGQVIQVVSATDSTNRSLTSTTFVTASNTLSVSITPSSASNKIFVIASTCMISPFAQTIFSTIFREATNLGTANGITQATGNSWDSSSLSILDSPSTTSAITYQVYYRVDSGTGSINGDGTKTSITAFEIKG